MSKIIYIMIVVILGYVLLTSLNRHMMSTIEHGFMDVYSSNKNKQVMMNQHHHLHLHARSR
jgi:hypothetical protein